MKRTTKNWRSDLGWAYLVILTSVCLLVLPLYCFVNSDAGYTLSMARAIARGSRLFSDLAVSHTTVAMFLYAGIAHMFPDENLPFGIALAVMLLFEVGSGVLVFTIARQLGFAMKEGLLAALITVLSMLVSQGLLLELEPFVAFFSLVALYFFFRHVKQKSDVYVFLSGLCSGVAILFKQYGILTACFLAVALLCLPDERSLRARFSSATIMFGTATLVWVGYFTVLWITSGEALSVIGDAFFGKWYKKMPEEFPAYLRDIILLHPFAALVPVLIIAPVSTQIKIIAGLGLVSLVPGFVRQYPHYYIQAIPFFCLAYLELWGDSGPLRVFPRRARRAMQILSLAPLVAVASLNVLFLSSNAATKQQEMVAGLRSVIPKHSKVLVLGDFALFYLCDFESPSPRVLGYSFPHVLSPSQLIETMGGADYVLIDRGWVQRNDHFFAMLPLQYPEIVAALDSLGAQQSTVGSIGVYKIPHLPDSSPDLSS